MTGRYTHLYNQLTSFENLYLAACKAARNKGTHISAAPFRDRVVHHALCRIIEPIFDRTFIYDSYANRPGKGTHAAIRRAQDFFRKNIFVLKCDIQKYFASTCSAAT
ncbi:hypothetical protein EH223_03530 [candidate division KSB1 bacterium]|nr:hypothetical protein [candidate division KSB1 bacterium]RQW05894.1 MAG: hypothetical protein EH223_03530 [candidate division KSB1 bacterium]